METDQVAKAEWYVQVGEDCVERQRRMVERMRLRGRDAGPAEVMLATMETTLTAFRAHRDLMTRTRGGPACTLRPVAPADGGLETRVDRALHVVGPYKLRNDQP